MFIFNCNVIYIYKKFNNKYNLNLIIALSLVILFILFEKNIEKNNIEKFITYPNFKKEYLPKQKLRRHKIYDYEKISLKVVFYISSFKKFRIITHLILIQINDLVYLSGNIFNDNSRLVSTYKLNKELA